MKPIELPEGAKDTLPAACTAKRRIQQRMRDTFWSFGYTEIETPVFEYLDTFAYGEESLEPEKMLRFFEAGKKTMVLRPTPPCPSPGGATKMRMPNPSASIYRGHLPLRADPVRYNTLQRTGRRRNCWARAQ